MRNVATVFSRRRAVSDTAAPYVVAPRRATRARRENGPNAGFGGRHGRGRDVHLAAAAAAVANKAAERAVELLVPRECLGTHILPQRGHRPRPRGWAVSRARAGRVTQCGGAGVHTHTLLHVYLGRTSLHAGHLITHTGRPHELLMISVRYLPNHRPLRDDARGARRLAIPNRENGCRRQRRPLAWSGPKKVRIPLNAAHAKLVLAPRKVELAPVLEADGAHVRPVCRQHGRRCVCEPRARGRPGATRAATMSGTRRQILCPRGPPPPKKKKGRERSVRGRMTAMVADAGPADSGLSGRRRNKGGAPSKNDR